MNAATPATIMLVHGACHGPWCWDRVTPLLEADGRRVLTPCLPGREGIGRGGWGATLPDYATAIIDAARRESAPVVAVGHSMAGLVIAAAAEAAPEIFERLVFVSAFMPVSGDSLASIAAMDKHSDLPGATTIGWLSGTVAIKPEKLGPVYYGDCSEADLGWVRPRLVPEPLRPSLGKVQLSAAHFQSVPRSYIRCTQDRGLSIEMQDRLIERQPCERVATLEASHSSFVSMPDQFVAALLSVT